MPHLIPCAPLVAIDPAGAVLPLSPCQDGPLAPARLQALVTPDGEAALAGPLGSWRLGLTRARAPGSIGTVSACGVDGGFARWVEGGMQREMLLSTATRLPAGIKRLLVFLLMGQSLRSGRNSLPVLHGAPVDAQRAFMLSGGVRPLGAQSEAQKDELYPWQALADLVPLREQQQGLDGETVASGLAAWVLPHLPADTAVVFVNCAVGAQPYEELCRGQPPFANAAAAVGRLRTLAEIHDVDLEIAGAFWCQGGANAGDALESYRGKMLQLHGDLQDIGAMIGQGAVTLWLTQMTHNSTAEMAVARAQLAAADTPGIVCVGPEYPYPSAADELLANPGGGSPNDAVHLSNYSQGLAGAYVGRAWLYGPDWQPLQATGPGVRAGTLIRIPYNVDAGNIGGGALRVAGSHVVEPGQAGLRWLGGGGVAINAVGPSPCGAAIEVHLAGLPTAPLPPLIVANSATATTANRQGPRVGARSTIHVESADTVTYGGREMPMHHFASVEVIEIEEAA